MVFIRVLIGSVALDSVGPAQEVHELPEGVGPEDQPLVLAVLGEAALEELGTFLAPVAAPVALAVVGAEPSRVQKTSKV